MLAKSDILGRINLRANEAIELIVLTVINKLTNEQWSADHENCYGGCSYCYALRRYVDTKLAQRRLSKELDHFSPTNNSPYVGLLKKRYAEYEVLKLKYQAEKNRIKGEVIL